MRTGAVVLRRRGWVIVVSALIAAFVAFGVSGIKKPVYSASAYLVVSAGASAKGPGSASEAANLATTYAGLIPKDSSILTSVSSVTRTPVSDVRSAISVFTESGTSILEVRYKAPTASAALAGDRAVAEAVGGPAPVSPAIAAGAVSLASLPTQAIEGSSTHSLAVPFGLIGGLILGLVLMLAWERVDPRIDDLDDVSDVTNTPATALAQISVPQAGALIQRWLALIGGEGAIGLVASSPRMKAAVQQWSRELLSFSSRYSGSRAGESPPDLRNVAVVAYGMPGDDEVGQSAALDCQVVVLVVERGCRAKQVAAARRILEEFGHSPDWTVLIPRRRGRLSHHSNDAEITKTDEDAAILFLGITPTEFVEATKDDTPSAETSAAAIISAMSDSPTASGPPSTGDGSRNSPQISSSRGVLPMPASRPRTNGSVVNRVGTEHAAYGERAERPDTRPGDQIGR